MILTKIHPNSFIIRTYSSYGIADEIFKDQKYNGKKISVIQFMIAKHEAKNYFIELLYQAEEEKK
jgi:hypothetical protein